MDKLIIEPHYQKYAETMFCLDSGIANFYENNASFTFLNIENNFVLFQNFSLLCLKNIDGIELKQIPLSDYIRGLNDGYTHIFSPFVDTPETRKELILREVFRSKSSFPVTGTKGNKFISNQNSYLHGFEVGKRYKAWNYIFETPDYFVEYFTRFDTDLTRFVLTLEKIFADSQNLNKLVLLLKDKGFVIEEAGRLIWSRKPVEFAAMAKVCEPLILEKYHSPKILHSAWTSYFLHKSKSVLISETYFKGNQKNSEIHFHQKKFEFIKENFGIE